ncbi:MAG: TonB-dependent receptor [Bacteroidia bacterium]|nr:TonB-dependent receptor [Bacteroidia bacterium]
MKITIFIVVFASMQTFALDNYAQTKRMDVKIEEAGIVAALEKIEAQSEFFFFYNNKVVKLDKIVSVDLKNKTINEILDAVFKDTDIEYTINNRQIILSGKEIGSSLSQQQKSVSGKVTDSSGGALPGVTVVVRGTTNGTITNANGNYSLSNIQGNTTLIFSFIGMKTQEVSVGNKNAINVTLAEETVGIEEVVAVGYGTQKKASLTGSVVEVKNENIINTPVANITNTLSGRLPGIFAVQRSGEPGQDAADISIRGFGNALIIVDGIERSSIQFNQIEPNAIESISVLKDASASIYGARAGNGVILVTTKRGKTGKPVINFNVSNAYQSTTRLPDFINSGEFAVSFNDALRAVGAPAYFSDYQVKAYRAIVGESVDFTAAERSQYEAEKPYLANTDWIGTVFKPVAPMQQYNLNSTGGNDKIKYFLSLGYLDQKSVLRSGDDNFKKYTIQSNIDAQISKDLSVGFDLSARLSKTEYPGYPISWIWNSTINDIPTTPLNKDPRYPTGLGQATAEADASGYRKNDTKELSGSFSMNYSVPFVKGLSAKARVDYSTTTGFDKSFLKAYQVYTYDTKNDIYTPRGGESGGTTRLSQNYSESRNLLSKIMLEYENVFGRHAVKALAVGEYTDFSNIFFSAFRTNYLSNAIDQLFAGSSNGMLNNGGETADGRISYASRINYAYSNKYLLETTLRYDASPRFAPDQRWGLFPSVLVGWRLSEESFMKNKLKFINNLKLRLSYGQSGVDNIASYNYLSGFSYAGGFVDNAAFQLGLQTKGLANLIATWEKHTTYNAGIDFDLWNSKIYGGFDVFYKERSGILAKRLTSLPSTFGATLPSENLNSMNYRGFELQLGHTGKIGELKYRIDGNIAWNRAKNVHIEEPDFSTADKYTRLRYQQSGQWTNQYYGLDAVGLFQSQAEIDAWPVIQDNNLNKTLRPGDIKYLDFDGDKKITQTDYHVIGRGNTPELNYGLNINGNFKGFDLSMLWYGASNYSTLMPYMSPYGPIPSTIFKAQLDYWTPQNTGASLPRIGNGGFTNDKFPSTFWLVNIYYVRLKNVQLGYSLPPRLFKNIGVSNCRVYLSAVNWLTITNFKDFDPETVSSGTYGFFPQQKTLGFGANITL